MFTSFQQGEAKRISTGRALKLHEFNDLNEGVAALMAEIVEGKRTGLELEVLLSMQSTLDRIRSARIKEADVAELPPEDDFDAELQIKLDEFDDTRNFIITQGDASEVLARLNSLERFYSRLELCELKDAKLEEIEQLRKLAKRMKATQSSSAEAAILTPKRVLPMSQKGCKDALDWIRNQLVIAEGSLSRANDIVASLRENIRFLHECENKHHYLSLKKFNDIVTTANRLSTACASQHKEFERLYTAIPEALQGLEVDKAEKMVLQFLRLIQTRKGLPSSSEEDKILSRYENTARLTLTHIPDYRQKKHEMDELVAALQLIEDDFENIKGSDQQALCISGLNSLLDSLKTFKNIDKAVKPIMRRIIKLKIDLLRS